VTVLDALTSTLERLNAEQRATPTMAHTRMQAAIPVTASRKIRSWRDPLLRHRARLETLKDEVLVLHFAGPAGTLEKLGDKGHSVGKAMARDLGLEWVGGPRHSERDGLVAFASWLSLVTGSLGKMGQDIALMAQSEVGEVRLASGGGSSACARSFRNPCV
jgi:3-carboxy-cis,cis-muconate cycloisomerase